MSLKQKQVEVIEILAKHEEAAGQLYEEYAQRFPDYKDFWSTLTGDEMEHAVWIRGLHSQIEEGSVYFKEGRFKMEAIKNSLDYLKGRLTEAQKEEISLIKALSIARDIEKALIEKKFFEVFEGDSVELKEVLLNLEAATKEHMDRIEKVWAKHTGRLS